MERRYTVKEIRNMTGLSKQEISRYKKTIPPCKHEHEGINFEGHKIYDETGWMKFKQVAIFREFNMSHKEIRERMDVEQYDCNRILEEQLILLKKKRKHIDELIFSVEQMRVTGIKNEAIVLFSEQSLSEYAQRVSALLQSDYGKKIQNLSDEKIQNFRMEMDTILRDFSKLKSYSYGSEEVVSQVKKLHQSCITNMGFTGTIILFVLGFASKGGGEISEEIVRVVDNDETVEFIGQAIITYGPVLLESLLSELENELTEYEAYFGVDIEDEKARKIADLMRPVLKKYFGLCNTEEFEFILPLLKEICNEDTEGDFQFLVNVMIYYYTNKQCKKEKSVDE